MPLEHITPQDHRLLQDVADSLATSHKILIVTGAGISTSCGIPDFRSKYGLYSLIQRQRNSRSPTLDEPKTPSKKRKFSDVDDISFTSSQESVSSKASKGWTATGASIKGKDLFDARLWKDPVSTSVFYTFIASLRQQVHDEVKQTSQTHKFIRVLRDGGRLMRCYTQNIDGLEAREGLSSDLSRGKGNKRRFMKKVYESPRPSHIDKNSDYDGGCEVVPLHGDLEKLRCNLCQKLVDWSEGDTASFLEGEAPHCQACSFKAQNRRESGKRGLSIGLLRPNIVLYQEQHPSEQLLATLPPFDMAQGPEVLVIMGTSLKVHGLQNLVREFAKAVHSKDGRVIFVNRTKPSESIWTDFIDDWVEMDCDDWVTDLRTRREDLWLRQGELKLKTTKAGISKPRKRKSTGGRSPPAAQPQHTVAVVIHTKRTEPPVDAAQVHQKKRRKSRTPTSPLSGNPLPTPPPSHGKNGGRPDRGSERNANHTPWTSDSTLTPSAQRRRRLWADTIESPDFSPVHQTTSAASTSSGLNSSPIIPRSDLIFPNHSVAFQRGPFTIYTDPYPQCSAPYPAPSIRQRDGHFQSMGKGILTPRTDANTRAPATTGEDADTRKRCKGQVNGGQLHNPIVPRRTRLSIHDLLN